MQSPRYPAMIICDTLTRPKLFSNGHNLCKFFCMNMFSSVIEKFIIYLNTNMADLQSSWWVVLADRE